MKPITPPVNDTTDPRPSFAAATRTLRAVVSGVEPAQFGKQTPCTGMDVRELIDHVGMAVGRVAAAGQRLPLDQWPTTGFSVGEDPVAGIDGLVEEAIDAWDTERLAEQVQLPWTTLSGAQALAVYVNEVLVHTWDLATATGQDPDYDDDAISVAESVMHRELPEPERASMWETFKAQMPEGIPFEAPFADAVPVGDDSPAIVRLVAWNGREPKTRGRSS